MNNPRLTILLLVLIILAAMWTSGRLTALTNTMMGVHLKKESKSG